MVKGPFASAAVQAWLDAGNKIAAFWTEDRRMLRLGPHDRLVALLTDRANLRSIARRHNIPIRVTPTLTKWDGALDAARATGADTLITLMTHLIIPTALLDHFGKSALNFHPTLLPHYKGPRPRDGLFVDGKGGEYSGLTLHVLSPGIDEGPIIAQQHLPCESGAQMDHWDGLAVGILARMIKGDAMAYLRGTLQAVPQGAGGNYRHMAKDEFSVTAQKTLAEARHLAQCLHWDRLYWTSGDRGARFKKRHPILPRIDPCGAPTGAPPQLRFRTIEIDLADQRVRLHRMGRLGALMRALSRVRAMNSAKSKGR